MASWQGKQLSVITFPDLEGGLGGERREGGGGEMRRRGKRTGRLKGKGRDRMGGGRNGELRNIKAFEG